MRKTKIIKTQAKSRLEGKWIMLIAAISAAFLLFLTLQYVEALVGYVLGFGDENGAAIEGKETGYIILAAGFSVLTLFVSPVLNGVLRLGADITSGKDEGFGVIFTYFRSFRKYLKTLVMNFLLFLIYSILSSALDAYKYLELLFGGGLGNEKLDFGASAALVGGLVFSILVKLAVYMLFLHYPLAAYALNDNRRVTDYVFGLIGFSAKNFGKLLVLMLSFSGWFLLCFFVVPAMYVFPFFIVSALTSARWLFSMDSTTGIVY